MCANIQTHQEQTESSTTKQHTTTGNNPKHLDNTCLKPLRQHWRQHITITRKQNNRTGTNSTKSTRNIHRITATALRQTCFHAKKCSTNAPRCFRALHIHWLAATTPLWLKDLAPHSHMHPISLQDITSTHPHPCQSH